MFKPSDLPTLHRMQAARDRINAMRHKRAVAAYCKALGGKATASSHLDICVIHNSLIARENGKPWAEVDYSAMRLANHLTEDYRASRLVDAWYKRKCGIKG